MTTTQDLRRALTAEAKTLRSRIAELRDQRDALTPDIERAGARYMEACGGGGPGVKPEAEELGQRHVALRERLNRGENERKDAELRLADLDRMLDADDAAAAAEKAVSTARQSVAAIEAKINTGTQARAKWQALAADAFRQAEAARAVNTARARHALPDDVRAELGIEGEAPAAPAVPPAELEQQAIGYSEAAEQAQAKVDALQQDLAAARSAEEQAVIELLAQRAYVAEMQHAAALAQYLPELARFRAAHDLAFGYMPELPAFKRHADESHGQAIEAARAAAEPKVEAGLMSRVRRVVGLA